MDQEDSNMNREHVIDIISSLEANSSSSLNGPSQRQDQSSTTVRNPIAPQPPTLVNGSNIGNELSIRTENGNGHRRRDPLNYGVRISAELALTVCQIVVAIVVLPWSKHENPRTTLFGWIVFYVSGCAVNLPLLYWKWYYRDQASENGSQNREGSIQNILSATITNLSNTWNSEGNNQPIGSNFRGPQVARAPNPRLKALVDQLKITLCSFFGVWFVVGNVWLFGGHTSPTEAPNSYWFCILFLTYSCIGYLIPFIMCATVCCWALFMISVMGFRLFRGGINGATSESINSLPVYKYKIKKPSNASGRENNSAAVEGGVVAAGTEKEHAISGEDAVCCICLAKYANNDELRELPCIHLFHKDCVDKWLKINASCPLCKGKVGESTLSSVPEASAL